jgi:uncharacterized protein
MKQPRWLSRIHTLALALGALGVIGGSVLPTATLAQDIKFFRIGTGGTAGTYYPVGGLIANAISNAPGSRPCDQGGSCGVPGLVATAVASNGSVANVNGIAGGALESGFSQSDVAYWAYTGTGVFEGKPKVTGLRLIANLYPESIHLVARKGSGIRRWPTSRASACRWTNRALARWSMRASSWPRYGMTEADVKAEYLKPNQAGDKLRDGGLDAFFFVGGYRRPARLPNWPAGAGIELVPIDGAQADARANTASLRPT